jgi:hypothetical protein
MPHYNVVKNMKSYSALGPIALVTNVELTAYTGFSLYVGCENHVVSKGG